MFSTIFKYGMGLAALVVTVLALYLWLGASISLDYARQQQKTLQERVELMREFALATNQGTSRSEISRLLKADRFKKHLIKETENSISVDEVVFRFNAAGGLSRIEFVGEEQETDDAP